LTVLDAIVLNRVLKGQQWEDNARRLDERSMGTGGGAVKVEGRDVR